MIKLCIFDLDGTLLDTIKGITYFVNQTLAAEAIAPISEKECKRFVGDGARLLIHRALVSRGIDSDERTDDILKKYLAAYNAEPNKLTEAYDGIVSALAALRKSGVRLAVLSNKPNVTTLAVVERYFPNTFDAVYGARDSVELKPVPDAALAIARELGALPSEVAFIGDTSVDIITGKNMEAALSVGVLWGFREEAELLMAGADCLARTALDLPRIILGV